jgi:hypothetical protein
MKIEIGTLTLLALAVVLSGAGCANQTLVQQPSNSTAERRVITYLFSKEEPAKYCNGADMDTDGYQKTITQIATTTTPPGDGTEAELVKTTLGVATTGMCQTVMKQLDFTVASGTVYIPQFGAWAGVSITMCSCKPQVEVNLLRMPNIKKVIWQ